MTQENANTESSGAKVHGNTKKAADLDLAKRRISRDSHAAVHEGRISLEEARELGREGSPFAPAPKTVSKDDRSRPCMCGCGNRTRGGRFVPGHDVRLVTFAKQYVRGERQLTDEQMEYVATSGKLERARMQVQKEDEQARERAAKQAERAAKKAGAKKRTGSRAVESKSGDSAEEQA